MSLVAKNQFGFSTNLLGAFNEVSLSGGVLHELCHGTPLYGIYDNVVSRSINVGRTP